MTRKKIFQNLRHFAVIANGIEHPLFIEEGY